MKFAALGVGDHAEAAYSCREASREKLQTIQPDEFRSGGISKRFGSRDPHAQPRIRSRPEPDRDHVEIFRGEVDALEHRFDRGEQLSPVTLGGISCAKFADSIALLNGKRRTKCRGFQSEEMHASCPMTIDCDARERASP